MLEPEVLARSVSSLNPSTRVAKAFRYFNIETIGQLVKMTEEGLLTKKNFGQSCLIEVKARLAVLGLALRPSERQLRDMPDWPFVLAGCWAFPGFAQQLIR